MKKTLMISILFILIICVLAGNIVYSQYSEKIPDNDPYVTGNTAGNLNNSGLYCESDGKVFFANAYDNYSLYSMNSDESEIQKLSSGKASSINAAGNFIYYYMEKNGGGDGFNNGLRAHGVYRTKKDGSKSACLTRDAAVTMQLVGNYLYYQRYNNQDYTKFYKLKTDKSENIKISDDIINPAAVDRGIIYFNGQKKDHYLYALNTANDTSSLVYQGNLWYPVVKDQYVYYMDVSGNYRICRYSLLDGSVEILTNDRVDSFNVGDFYIYYQKNDSASPALMRMRLDGSEPEIVKLGNYTNINLTSNYVYFSEFHNEIPIYHTPVNGPVNVSTFMGAANAALESTK